MQTRHITRLLITHHEQVDSKYLPGVFMFALNGQTRSVHSNFSNDIYIDGHKVVDSYIDGHMFSFFIYKLWAHQYAEEKLADAHE